MQLLTPARVLRALVVPLAAALLVTGARAAEPVAVGAVAPPIHDPTARGTFDSATSRKPYVLEFFAVWCPHCQHEVPVMNQLEKSDGDRVDVIAVPASPFGFDKATPLNDADVHAFEDRFHVTYRIGYDGFLSESFDYGVTTFPVFYVVSADRHVVAIETGEVPFATLHADVQRALAPTP